MVVDFEDGLLDVLGEEGIGCIGFSPLCQGILTNKYIDRIPEESRAGKWPDQLYWGDSVSEERLVKVRQLNEIAKARGQSMAQMAVAWTMRNPVMTSALIGASRVGQIEEIVAALTNLEFTKEELNRIDEILAS